VTTPVPDPATLTDGQIAVELSRTITALLTAIGTQNAIADVLRRRVATLEAESIARRKRQEAWERWTLGHRAIVLTMWHAEDLARAEDSNTSKPMWRPGNIGLRTVAEALGGPPPQPFTTPESGGPMPLPDIGACS
jgi:hypothetical protein